MKKTLFIALALTTAAFIGCTRTSSPWNELSSITANTPLPATPSASGITIASNFAAYGDQTVAPPIVHYKIGSYLVKNLSSTEIVHLTKLFIDATGLTTSTEGQVTNVMAYIGAVQYGPSLPHISYATGSAILINATVNPLATDTIDLYADIATGALASFRTDMIVFGTGFTSGTHYSTHGGSACSAQAIYLSGSSSCAVTPTFGAPMSSVSQYVAAGSITGVSNATQATFMLTSPTPTTVTELKVAVTGSLTATSVTVGSVIAPVVAGVAYVTGLSLAVPAGTIGATVTVHVSYPPVGPTGIPSGTNSQIALTYLKFACGTSVNNLTTSVPAPTMRLVASKPLLTVNLPSSVLAVGLTEVMDVAIAADPGGDIRMLSLPVSFGATNAAFSTTANNIVVKDAVGATVPTTNTAMPDGNTVITFSSGYLIPAGMTQTYKLFLPITSVTGAAGTAVVHSMLLPSAGFSWMDVDGSATTPETGTAFMPNYPSVVVSVHN